MATTDAKATAYWGVAHRVKFPIFDATGALVAGATGLDSEISKDDGTFVDCTNEATQIATSSGMYWLDITATEMEADAVVIIVKTTSSGAKTTPIVIYTEQGIRTRKAQAGAASTITLDTGASATNDLYNGLRVTIVGGTGAGQSRLATDYDGTTKVLTVDKAWITNPDATSIFHLSPESRVDVALLESADPSDTIRASIVTDDTRFAGASIAAISGFIDTEVGSILTNTAQLLTDVATLLGASVTEIADIKAKTDALPTDPADQSILVAAITAAEAAILARLPAALEGGRIASNIGAINGIALAAQALAESAAQMILFAVEDTGFAPTTTQFETASITEATANHFKDRLVLWRTGALAGQITAVTASSLVSGRERFTVVAMTEAPADGDLGMLI